MKRNRKELDSILDRVAAGIRSEESDAAVAGSAADRVWARIRQEAAAEVPEAVRPADEIRGCADFQSLIPAYLRKELSEARRLLVEDHTRECIPCRKALKAARGGAQTTRVVQPAAKPVSVGAQMPVWKWAIAATLLVGVGLVVYNVYRRIGVEARATVELASGAVYKVTDTESRALGVGEEIGGGETIRTAKDCGRRRQARRRLARRDARALRVLADEERGRDDHPPRPRQRHRRGGQAARRPPLRRDAGCARLRDGHNLLGQQRHEGLARLRHRGRGPRQSCGRREGPASRRPDDDEREP